MWKIFQLWPWIIFYGRVSPTKLATKFKSRIRILYRILILLSVILMLHGVAASALGGIGIGKSIHWRSGIALGATAMLCSAATSLLLVFLLLPVLKYRGTSAEWALQSHM